MSHQWREKLSRFLNFISPFCLYNIDYIIMWWKQKKQPTIKNNKLSLKLQRKTGSNQYIMYLTNMNISIYFIIDTSQNRTKFSHKEKIWSGQCVGHYLRMIWGGSTASTSVWAGSWALSFLFLYDSAASLICLIHLINEWRREMFICIIVSINGL